MITMKRFAIVLLLGLLCVGAHAGYNPKIRKTGLKIKDSNPVVAKWGSGETITITLGQTVIGDADWGAGTDPTQTASYVFMNEGDDPADASNPRPKEGIVSTPAGDFSETSDVPWTPTVAGVYRCYSKDTANPDWVKGPRLVVTECNLQVDSNNDSIINELDDEVEEDTDRPGATMHVNNSDHDADKILDYKDLDIQKDSADNPSRFAQLKVTVPEGVDLSSSSSATFRFKYTAADPADLTNIGSAKGQIRIWLKDADVVRNAANDFIKSGETTVDNLYSPNELGLDETTRTVTMYIEGISKSDPPGESAYAVNTITMYMLDTSSGFSHEDTVSYSVVDITAKPLLTFANIDSGDGKVVLTAVDAEKGILENSVVPESTYPVPISSNQAPVKLTWTLMGETAQNEIGNFSPETLNGPGTTELTLTDTSVAAVTVECRWGIHSGSTSDPICATAEVRLASILLVDVNHDGNLNAADNVGEDSPGAMMLAGFGIDNHPALGERIKVQIDAIATTGTYTISSDNDRVQFYESPTGGAPVVLTYDLQEYEDFPKTFYVQFYKDDIAEITATYTGPPLGYQEDTQSEGGGSSTVENETVELDKIKITRLSNGLGAPDGISAHHSAGPASINTMNGNLYFGAVARSFNTPALGPDLAVSYNQLDGIEGSLGMGWRTNYDMRLFGSSLDPASPQSGDWMVLIGETGRRYLFKHNGTEFKADDKTGPFDAKITRQSDGSYELIRHDGQILTFNDKGLLTEIKNIRDEKLTITLSNDLPTTVTDDYSRSVSIAAVGSRTSMSGYEMPKWTFVYETTGNFDRMVEAKIENDSRYESFLHGSSTGWKFKYLSGTTDLNKVVEVEYPDPTSGTASTTHKMTFDYGSTELMKAATAVTATFAIPNMNSSTVYAINPDFDLKTSVTNPSGVTTTFAPISEKRLIETVSRGSYSATMAYDDKGMMTSRAVSQGRSETWTYTAAVENAWLLESHTLQSDSGASTTAYTYEASGDAAGRVLTVTDPCGAVTTNTYSGGWLATSSITVDGTARLTNFTSYTTFGQPQTITYPGNSTTTIVYLGDQGQVQSETNQWGIMTSYGYDGLKRRNSTTVPSGSTSVTMDGLGNAQVQTDINGIVTTNTVDAWGRVTGSATSGGGTASIASVVTTYDYANDELTVETKRASRVLSKRLLDAGGRVLKVYGMGHDGSAAREKVMEYTYDTAGRVKTVSRWYWVGDSADGTITYTRNNAGWVTSVKDPEGKSSTTTYYTNGLVKSSKDADNVGMTYTYDACGRQLTATNDAGGKVTNVYNEAGQIKSQTPDDMNGVSYTYHADGRMATMTNVHGKVTTYDVNYGAKEMITTHTLGSASRTFIKNFNTQGFNNSTVTPTGTFTQDNFGNDGFAGTTQAPGRNPVTHSRDGLKRYTGNKITVGGTDIENKTEFDDTQGDVETSTNAMNNVHTPVTDAQSGETTSSSDSISTLHTVKERDANGNVTKSEDAESLETVMAYDKNGRLVYSKGPDGVAHETTYTDAGRVKTTKINGTTQVTYEYNALGLQSSVDYASSLVDLSFTYDNHGRKLTKTHGDQTTTWTYYANTKQLNTVSVGPDVTQYFYDSDGRLLTVYHNSNQHKDFEYDDTLNAVKKVKFGDGTHAENTEHEANGDVKKIERVKTGSSDTSVIEPKTDLAGRNTGAKYSKTTAGVTESVDVTKVLDGGGNVLSETIVGDYSSITRQFDVRGRLVEEVQRKDNTTITTITYTYRHDDQLLNVKLNGNVYLSYGYDANTGLLTSITESGTNKSAAITYDDRSRVRTFTISNGVSRRYWYDDGDRVIRTRQTAGLNSETIEYRYSTSNGLLQSVSGNGYTITYAYDSFRRLSLEKRTGKGAYQRDYSYDSYHNRIGYTEEEEIGASIGGGSESFDGPGLPSIATILQDLWTIEADGTASRLAGVHSGHATYSGAAQIKLEPTTQRLGQLTVKVKPDLSTMGTQPMDIGFSFVDPMDATKVCRAGIQFTKEDGVDENGDPIVVYKRRLVAFQYNGTTPAGTPPADVPSNWQWAHFAELPALAAEETGVAADYDGSELTLSFVQDNFGNLTLRILEDQEVNTGTLQAMINDPRVISTDYAMNIPAYPAQREIRLYVFGRADFASPKAWFDDLTWITYTPGTTQTNSYTYEYSSDGMNHLQNVKKNGTIVKSFTYDAAGRITSRTDDGVTQTLGYDPIGRVTSIAKGAETHAYSYYASSWRRSNATWTRDVNGTETTTSTDYLWNGMNCIQQKTLTSTTVAGNSTTVGNLTTNYAYHGGTPLWETTTDNFPATPTTNTKYFLSNGRGNIEKLYDPVGGIEQERTYDAYGIEKGDANPQHYSRLGYRSQLTDASGLQYLRHRYYDPTLGRFMSQDPAQDGTNWQIYANSDPVNYYDPTGLITLAAALKDGHLTVKEASELELTRQQIRQIIFYYGKTEDYLGGWKEAEENWRINWDSFLLDDEWRDKNFRELKRDGGFPKDWTKKQVFGYIADQHNLRWARYRILKRYNRTVGLYSAFARGTAPVAEYLATAAILGASFKAGGAIVKITRNGVRVLYHGGSKAKLANELRKAKEAQQAERIVRQQAKNAANYQKLKDALDPRRLRHIVDDAVNSPQQLWGKTADEIAEAFRREGYEVAVEQSTKGSRLSVQVRIKGHKQISNIQVHPGGGIHSGAYVKISTNKGIVKVIDPKTYVPTSGEKATMLQCPTE